MLCFSTSPKVSEKVWTDTVSITTRSASLHANTNVIHVVCRYMLSPVVLKRSVHQQPCTTLRHVDWLVVDMVTYYTAVFLGCIQC